MLWFFDSLLQDAICYKLLEQTIVSFFPICFAYP